jgi:hypothetical protein
MLVVLSHEEHHPIAVPENVALDKLTVVTAVAHRSVDPLWHLNLVLPTGEQLRIQLRTCCWGGPKNRRESPNTRVRNKCTKVTKRRQRIFERLYLPQKL